MNTFWFYPGALHCDFQDVASTRLSNQSSRCAPLGVWRGTHSFISAEYSNGGHEAQDLGFILLDPDTATGSTIDDASSGLQIEFGTAPTGGWDVFGYRVFGSSQVSLHTCSAQGPAAVVPLTDIAGPAAGVGFDWLIRCPGMTGGASGGAVDRSFDKSGDRNQFEGQ
jgi:hypothetical protein